MHVLYRPHSLHYANELLVRIRLTFQKLLQTHQTSRNKKKVSKTGFGYDYEREASEASLFCFDNASLEKSCFVDGLVCFFPLCLRVFEFLNATRRD